jgi:hypothetical protein
MCVPVIPSCRRNPGSARRLDRRRAGIHIRHGAAVATCAPSPAGGYGGWRGAQISPHYFPLGGVISPSKSLPYADLVRIIQAQGGPDTNQPPITVVRAAKRLLCPPVRLRLPAPTSARIYWIYNISGNCMQIYATFTCNPVRVVSKYCCSNPREQRPRISSAVPEVKYVQRSGPLPAATLAGIAHLGDDSRPQSRTNCSHGASQVAAARTLPLPHPPVRAAGATVSAGAPSQASG